MVRSIRLVLATLLIALAGMIVMPATAGAAAACRGSLIEWDPIKTPGGTTVAALAIYWDGNTNCAMTYHQGPAYGVRAHTKIEINVCYHAWPGRPCTVINSAYNSDIGDYSYYAGPIYPNITSTNGLCIDVDGAIVWNGAYLTHDTGWSHCGASV